MKKQKTKVKKKPGNYPFEFRLRAVKLVLEEGYSIGMVAEELNYAQSSIGRWMRRYRTDGETALSNPATKNSKSKQPKNSDLKNKIIALKKEDPQRGIKRISDILRSFFS